MTDLKKECEILAKMQQKLFELILAADRTSADKLLEEWAGINGYEQAVMELLEPALQLLGQKWATTKDVSLAQGYIAGKIAEDIMKKTTADDLKNSAIPELKGPVVMGNIEDDFHALGRKLVVIFLRTARWKVYDLGNDVLAAEFVNKAVEVGARVIGVSAMMYTNAMNIRKLRKEIDQRGLKDRIKLAVGGAVFVIRPELVKEVGGDGTARNAVAAIDLMRKLSYGTVTAGATK